MLAAATSGEEVEGSWWTAPVQRPAVIKVKDSGGAAVDLMLVRVMVIACKD